MLDQGDNRNSNNIRFEEDVFQAEIPRSPTLGRNMSSLPPRYDVISRNIWDCFHQPGKEEKNLSPMLTFIFTRRLIISQCLARDTEDANSYCYSGGPFELGSCSWKTLTYFLFFLNFSIFKLNFSILTGYNLMLPETSLSCTIIIFLVL